MNMDFDVAVIGAGIIGASIAARLCSAGMAVALIDKGAAGGGASGLSGGLVRLYDPDPLLMDLAAFSISLMDDGVFATTYARALQRSGVIYRAAPDQLSALCSAINQHATANYPMRLVASQAINGVDFAHCPDSERINLFEPRACIGNVRLAISLLTDVIRRKGLLLEHCTVQSVDCRAHDDVRIDLNSASLRCRAVVVAAGGWSRQLVPDLQLETRSIPLARVQLDADCNMPIIDAVAQSYVIPSSRHIVQTGCGFREVRGLPGDLPVTDSRNRRNALDRVRALSGCDTPEILDVLPGFDGYSPDGRPLLGFCDDDSPLFLATGMSGLGFKFAPGIAQIAFEQLQQRLSDRQGGAGWSALSPRRAMNPENLYAGAQP